MPKLGPGHHPLHHHRLRDRRQTHHRGRRHPIDGRRGRPGPITALSLLAVVLLAFVVSQLVALTGAGQRLVDSTGLTPAEYARTGFFHLCWATAIVPGFLAVLHKIAAPNVGEARSVRILGAAVPVLATGLVAVSLRRMAYYDQAFGLTMLRLAVIGAALWMGAVLLLVALRNAGFAARRPWVTAVAGALALTGIVAADIANPEAFVVRHNLARATAGSDVDLVYLGRLSDDALQDLVALRGSIADEPMAPVLLRRLACRPDATGVAALNTAAHRAAKARRRLGTASIVCDGDQRFGS